MRLQSRSFVRWNQSLIRSPNSKWLCADVSDDFPVIHTRRKFTGRQAKWKQLSIFFLDPAPPRRHILWFAACRFFEDCQMESDIFAKLGISKGNRADASLTIVPHLAASLFRASKKIDSRQRFLSRPQKKQATTKIKIPCSTPSRIPL